MNQVAAFFLGMAIWCLKSLVRHIILNWDKVR